MASKGSAANANAIAEKYAVAADLALRLQATLGEIETLIVTGEKEPELKVTKVIAAHGGASLVVGAIMAEAGEWGKYADARARR
jgi:hypothetical protein